MCGDGWLNLYTLITHQSTTGVQPHPAQESNQTANCLLKPAIIHTHSDSVICTFIKFKGCMQYSLVFVACHRQTNPQMRINLEPLSSFFTICKGRRREGLLTQLDRPEPIKSNTTWDLYVHAWDSGSHLACLLNASMALP